MVLECVWVFHLSTAWQIIYATAHWHAFKAIVIHFFWPSNTLKCTYVGQRNPNFLVGAYPRTPLTTSHFDARVCVVMWAGVATLPGLNLWTSLPPAYKLTIYIILCMESCYLVTQPLMFWAQPLMFLKPRNAPVQTDFELF